MKTGDKVYCVESRQDPMYSHKTLIEKGKIYTIDKIHNNGRRIELVEETFYYYSLRWFISMSEYRKQKLQKINESR